MASDRRRYEPLARQVALREGVDPDLYAALIRAESNFDPTAGSPAGAQGLAQLMPGTARGLGVNPNIPMANLTGGARYLRQQLRAFEGDVKLALAAYNAGPGAVRKYGGIPPFAETQAYVPRVLGYMGQGATPASAAPPAPDGAAPGGGAAPPDTRLSMLRALRALREPGADRIGGLADLVALRNQAAGAPGAPAASPPTPALSPAGAGGFTMGGGPEAHASRALGNWQSDLAFDLMGAAGQAVRSTVTGRVVKVSGQPGGDPGFAGYGITIETPQGKLFFKHLGSTPLDVGSQVSPGGLIGTLDPRTAGGPHLHLGGQNRAFLEQLARAYTRRGR